MSSVISMINATVPQFFHPMMGTKYFLLFVYYVFQYTDKPPRIVKAFSAIENSRKIFAVRVNIPGEISCLHGMRSVVFEYNIIVVHEKAVQKVGLIE